MHQIRVGVMLGVSIEMPAGSRELMAQRFGAAVNNAVASRGKPGQVVHHPPAKVRAMNDHGINFQMLECCFIESFTEAFEPRSGNVMCCVHEDWPRGRYFSASITVGKPRWEMSAARGTTPGRFALH
jgi:hypothetical protein